MIEDSKTTSLIHKLKGFRMFENVMPRLNPGGSFVSLRPRLQAGPDADLDKYRFLSKLFDRDVWGKRPYTRYTTLCNNPSAPIIAMVLPGLLGPRFSSHLLCVTFSLTNSDCAMFHVASFVPRVTEIRFFVVPPDCQTVACSLRGMSNRWASTLSSSYGRRCAPK